MIISDATILITLINIDEFRVLKLFIDNIIIPSEVYNEISQKPSAKSYLDTQIDEAFISVETYAKILHPCRSISTFIIFTNYKNS